MFNSEAKLMKTIHSMSKKTNKLNNEIKNLMAENECLRQTIDNLLGKNRRYVGDGKIKPRPKPIEIVEKIKEQPKIEIETKVMNIIAKKLNKTSLFDYLKESIIEKDISDIKLNSIVSHVSKEKEYIRMCQNKINTLGGKINYQVLNLFVSKHCNYFNIIK